MIVELKNDWIKLPMWFWVDKLNLYSEWIKFTNPCLGNQSKYALIVTVTRWFDNGHAASDKRTWRRARHWFISPLPRPTTSIRTRPNDDVTLTLSPLLSPARRLFWSFKNTPISIRYLRLPRQQALCYETSEEIDRCLTPVRSSIRCKFHSFAPLEILRARVRARLRVFCAGRSISNATGECRRISRPGDRRTSPRSRRRSSASSKRSALIFSSGRRSGA